MKTLRNVLSSNADDPDSYEKTVLEPRLSELEAARARAAQARLQQSGTTEAEKLELRRIATYNRSISTVSNYLAMAAAFPVQRRRHGGRGIAQTAAHKKHMNELYVSAIADHPQERS